MPIAIPQLLCRLQDMISYQKAMVSIKNEADFLAASDTRGISTLRRYEETLHSLKDQHANMEQYLLVSSNISAETKAVLAPLHHLVLDIEYQIGRLEAVYDMQEIKINKRVEYILKKQELKKSSSD
jgi:hypothetical protein